MRPATFCFVVAIIVVAAAIVSAQDIPRPPLSKNADRPASPRSDPDDIKRLKREIATHPEAVEAWTTLGWRLYRQDRYAESDWVLGQARRLNAQDPYVLWLSGLAAYRMGRFADAKAFLHAVYFDRRTWPDTIAMDVTFDILGRLCLEEADLLSAAIYFDKAVAEAPGNWQYQFLRGFTEWYRQNYDRALESLEQARKLNPKDSVVLHYYAWARAAYDERWGEGTGKQKMARAIDAANEAINADPRVGDNYHLLGLIYSGIDESKAIEAFRKAISLDDTLAAPRYALAKMLLRTGTPPAVREAEELLVDGIAISPDYWQGSENAPHVTLLGAHLINSGRLGAARALLEWDAERQEGTEIP